MADSKYKHFVALYPITEDVGPNDSHLAPSALHLTAAFGKFRQAVRNGDEALCQTGRCVRIEGRNIGDDGFEVPNRLVGPEDLPQLNRRHEAGALAWFRSTNRASVARLGG